VVGPAFFHDLRDDRIHAVQAGLDAPVDGGQRPRGMESGWRGARIGIFLCGRFVGVGGKLRLVGRVLLRTRVFFLRNVAGEQAVAIGLLVQVAHELAPPEQLADEAFAGSERHLVCCSALCNVADEVERQEPAEVEQDGRFGVEELEMVVAHGVFKAAEGWQHVLEEEVPEVVAIGLGAGQIEVVEGAEVVWEVGLDDGYDFLRDGVGRITRRCGDGHLVLVGVAIVGVEGELAADGFCVAHEDAGLLAHAAVEAIHDIGFAGFVGAVGIEKLLRSGGPGGVWNEVDGEAVLLCGCEIKAEFALGG
jgi:hypothetical protein